MKDYFKKFIEFIKSFLKMLWEDRKMIGTALLITFCMVPVILGGIIALIYWLAEIIW